MRVVVLSLLVAGALLAPGGASAQQQASETDRLRDALRSAIAQTRALEDQRTQLTARATEAERKTKDLQVQLDATKKELKETDAAQRQAVSDFNARLDERNQALEKWKDAYGEAAAVARAKDSERATFEAKSKELEQRNVACQVRNASLVKTGRELLERYRAVHFGDRALAREPVTGIKKVEVRNTLQDFDDRILNEDMTR